MRTVLRRVLAPKPEQTASTQESSLGYNERRSNVVFTLRALLKAKIPGAVVESRRPRVKFLSDRLSRTRSAMSHMPFSETLPKTERCVSADLSPRAASREQAEPQMLNSRRKELAETASKIRSKTEESMPCDEAKQKSKAEERFSMTPQFHPQTCC
jgi:hypothetical protein